ncbi:adenine phosphoribosyltransferase [Aeromicrobium sp. IC_218]|uniref:adenine phosphoribosyltransferase n=1 Tax=Aeromicrobium sp. IC_218 TaxID=2545468 RepID=UPI0010396DEE|nr:adenine phosphoribosyltransferase [Aeromicrobium sp. IC_218]TCI99857.1 adenine phosphoribosyltransferase [Aeromicrobium sp. IC_218]
MTDLQELLDRHVRLVADWPEPGVTFRDITPLLAHAEAFAATISALGARALDLAGGQVDVIVGMEARGFILGGALARELDAGFVPVRKAGKLPGPTYAVDYALEYGTATLEMHQDAVAPGQRAVLVDDVLATGGTMAAADDLVRRGGGVVAGHLVLIELAALGGRSALGDSVPYAALATY